MAARQDNFGIALLSRRPITSHRVITEWGIGMPSIVARLDLDGRPLTIVATHPVPPVTPDYAADRDRGLIDLAEAVRRLERPIMVLGDLNATSWSPIFKKITAISKLRDSRKGFGLQPSWPTDFPRSLFRLPLDHCLVSEGLSVTNRRLGPNVGSDHLPVIVDFNLEPAPPS